MNLRMVMSSNLSGEEDTGRLWNQRPLLHDTVIRNDRPTNNRNLPWSPWITSP